MLCCVCALYKGVPLSNFLHKFQNLRSEGQMEKTDCFQTLHYCVMGKKIGNNDPTSLFTIVRSNNDVADDCVDDRYHVLFAILQPS